VLAGLISDEERSNANRVPGLGALPVLGRLFSSQKDETNKTEIVLLITPRVVRNLVRADTATVSRPAGSESNVGAKALQLRRADPKSLSITSRGAAGPVPVQQAEPEQPEEEGAQQ